MKRILWKIFYRFFKEEIEQAIKNAVDADKTVYFIDESKFKMIPKSLKGNK